MLQTPPTPYSAMYNLFSYARHYIWTYFYVCVCPHTPFSFNMCWYLKVENNSQDQKLGNVSFDEEGMCRFIGIRKICDIKLLNAKHRPHELLMNQNSTKNIVQIKYVFIGCFFKTVLSHVVGRALRKWRKWKLCINAYNVYI